MVWPGRRGGVFSLGPPRPRGPWCVAWYYVYSSATLQKRFALPRERAFALISGTHQPSARYADTLFAQSMSSRQTRRIVGNVVIISGHRHNQASS